MEDEEKGTPNAATGKLDGKPESLAGLSSTQTSNSNLAFRRDIYLHLEVLDSTQHKIAQGVWCVLMCTGLALCATSIYFREKGKQDYLQQLRSQNLIKLDTAFAVVCLSLLLAMLSWFLRCLRATWSCTWTRRQRYLVLIAFLQVLVQTVNVAFWLVPNVYILANKCHWFGGIIDVSVFIRWTCWNTVFCLIYIHAHNCSPALKKNRTEGGKKLDRSPDRGNPKFQNNERDPMILDGNFWRMHWLKLIYWTVFEAAILFLAVNGIQWRQNPMIEAPAFCPEKTVHHLPSLKYHILRIVWGMAIIIYQSCTQWSLRIALWRLRAQPYNCYQLGNLLLLWQVVDIEVAGTPVLIAWIAKRQTLWMDLVGVVEISTIYFAYTSIIGYFLQWTGQSALQVLITTSVVLNAFYFLPMEPSNEEHVYRAWLQDFAWTAAQVPKRQRALLKRSPTMGPRLHDKPMFCFEIGLRLLLWSDVVYEGNAGKKEDGPGLAGPVRAELETQQAEGLDGAIDSGIAEDNLRHSGGTVARNDSSEASSSGHSAPIGGVQVSGRPSDERDAADGVSAAAMGASDAGSEEEARQKLDLELASRSSSSSSASSTSEKARLADGIMDSGQVDVSERKLDDDGVLQEEKAPHTAVKLVSAVKSKIQLLNPESKLSENANSLITGSIEVDTTLSGKEQLELAMQMFKLQQLKVVHVPRTDTKVIISWSGQAMVLAFRGTNSMTNVRSDAKAWRAAHPPERGTYWLGTKPFVHKGFLRAWQQVSEQILEHVDKVLQEAIVPLGLFKVYLTGHSLGGALATLAAFDIQRKHNLANLSCYTIGAPRTGNTAFATEFAHLCPDCWHIINDRDAVPRTGKMLWMYKRPGERVLLSALGDIRVRPNIFEINLLTRGFSVKQHMLTAYLKAMGSVCVAQLFKHKAVDGGLHGVKRLSKSPEIRKLLASIGIDLRAALKHPPLEMASLKKSRCGGWTFLVDSVKDLPPFLNTD